MYNKLVLMITCCKSKELERNKEETKREFKGNYDDLVISVSLWSFKIQYL